MVDPLQHPAARAAGARPFAQAGDHVAPRGVGGGQAGGRAALALGLGDVHGVGAGDGGPVFVGLQPRGEILEEAGDLGVGDGAHGLEGVVRPSHGRRDPVRDALGDVQQRAGVLHHHQPVARPERLGQLIGHERDPVPAKGNRHARRQMLQQGGAHGVLVSQIAKIARRMEGRDLEPRGRRMPGRCSARAACWWKRSTLSRPLTTLPVGSML